MKVRSTVMIGIVGASLLAALPAQAYSQLPAGSFVLAKRSADEGGGRFDREEDNRQRDNRRAQKRDGGDRGYGYGYERRQREPDAGQQSIDEGRRQRDERRGDGRRG